MLNRTVSTEGQSQTGKTAGTGFEAPLNYLGGLPGLKGTGAGHRTHNAAAGNQNLAGRFFTNHIQGPKADELFKL